MTQRDKVLALDSEILDSICDNAKFVITGAYDGEGYIFWERKSDNESEF